VTGTIQYSIPSAGGSLNRLASATSAAASRGGANVISQSSLVTVSPTCSGVCRVPGSSAGAVSVVLGVTASAVSAGARSSLLTASSTASPFTVKNSMDATTAPITETTRAQALVVFDRSARVNPTMPRTNATGSRIHPTINAPGMQAKTKPITATINAASPMVLRAGGCGGPRGGGTGRP